MAGFFEAIGEPFGPNIAGNIGGGLQQGYALAQPPLQQQQSYISQLYPQAQDAIRGYGAQAAAPFQNLFKTFAPVAKQYASAVSGGPGSLWDAFTRSPLYTSGKRMGEGAINAAEAASGKLASGQQITDLSTFASDYNTGNWQAFINSLLPGVKEAGTAASGLSTALGTTGTNLAESLMGQAGAYWNPLSAMSQLGWSTGAGTGAAQAAQSIADTNIGGSILGGLLGLGSKLLPFSDERLKENVAKVGELYDGQNIYRFNYVWDDVPRIGLMADEVADRTPEAVIEHPSGYKMVNYDMATSRAAQLARLAA